MTLTAAARELTQTLLRAMLHPRAALQEARTTPRPRMLWSEEMITCVMATWLIQGLTMDSWAHTNQTRLETVITPWHGLFYGGFLLTAGWVVWRLLANVRAGHAGLAAIPHGYGVALIGMGLFFLSGVGDQIWHATFGIERDLEAFLSPTHLVLVIAMVLLVSTPFRSMWSDPRPRPTTFLAVLPAVWSIALVVLLLTDFGSYVVIFASDLPTISKEGFAAAFPGTAPQPLLDVFAARFQVQGVLMLYTMNLLLMGPVLLLLRRWRLPFGSVTFIWTLVVASDLVAYQFNRGWTLVAVVLAGLVADWLVLRLRPSGDRAGMFRLFAGLAPLPLWALYFVVLEVAYDVGWPVELAVGVGFIAGTLSAILAYVMIPTAVHVLGDERAAAPVEAAPPVVASVER
jgi:hypothetical protein